MAPEPDDDLPVVHFEAEELAPTPACISAAVRDTLTTYFGGAFRLFAMQAAVIAHLVHCAVDVRRAGDVVLRSPTGSGKTLAFAVPIAERLLRVRGAPARLRAVVVVPTHDLAAQVAAVFDALLADAPDVGVARATGATTVTAEAAAVAAAQVLVATPGRLADHTVNTPGVSLAHVEFLVLDESDRLLADAFDGWADVVLPRCGVPDADGAPTSTAPAPRGVLGLLVPAAARPRPGFGNRVSATRKILVSATATRDPQHIAKLNLQRVTYFEPSQSRPEAAEAKEAETKVQDGGEERVVGKVGGDKQYSVPQALSECAYVLSSPSQKPMALLSVLGWRTGADTAENDAGSKISSLPAEGAKLVFTKSVESAHRLARLLELFSREQSPAPIVLEISRDVSPKRRSAVLDLLSEAGASEDAKLKQSVVVVCSDVFARGMDIPSVEAVISYDSAVQVRTYLHRVGRTARAGRSGTAITLLLPKQVHYFKSMVRGIDRAGKKCKFRDVQIDGLRDSQQAALLVKRLSALKRVLRRESLGLLHTGECLPGHLLAEMSTDDAAVLRQHAARKRARFLKRERDHAAKRARSEAEMNGDRLVEDDEERKQQEKQQESINAQEGDDSGMGGNSDVEEDGFQDILRAHVARSWMRDLCGI